MDGETKRLVRAAKYCAMFGIGFFMLGLMLIVASLTMGKVDAAVPGVLFMALWLMCWAEYIHRINQAMLRRCLMFEKETATKT